MLAPPVFDATRDYGVLLGVAEHWLPYAELALARSGLPSEPMVSGFTGTYPTLVGPSLVVKMFGHFGDWRRSAEAEIAANEAIRAHRWIRAPKIIATGQLFPGRQDDWPFLISERLDGQAWRDCELTTRERMNLAVELGRQVKLVHGCCPVPGRRLHDDWLAAAHRTTAAARQRSRAVLPERLIDQIPDFLAGYRSGDQVLVHGDITEDHIFVDGERLVGLIDWGDAMITDPYYELGALHLGAFGADRRLLGSFLEGYGWPVDHDFARHAMQVALMHEFDLFTGVRDLARRADSLGDLADALWKLS